MAVIGIDLGTTYSAASIFREGQPQVISLDGHHTLPSVVSVLKSGKVVVGHRAKNNQAAAPHNTIIEVKRKMGLDEKVPLGDKTFSPQEISAMILQEIKKQAEEELNEPVTGAVISCPAYFKAPAHNATKEAGVIAGLEVLAVINEPTAAAYAYGTMMESGDEEKLFLVYDLGGGTFDVTVLRMRGGAPEVIGTGGDPQLGGGNFDDKIVDWMLDKIKGDNPEYAATLSDEKLRALRIKLKTEAEKGKIRLCESQEQEAAVKFQLPSVDRFQGKPIKFTETLTKAQFEEMIRPLLENSLQWLDEAMKVPKQKHKYSEADLTAILLVGGSTRIPLVYEMLRQRFPGAEIRGHEAGINPDEIVAMGAAIWAARIDPDSDEVLDVPGIDDVTGHTLSVAVFDDEQNCQTLHHLIAKETFLPCRNEHRFQSQGKFQTQCKVEVYQGEQPERQPIDPSAVTLVGEFLIFIDPIEKPTPLVIGLSLDRDGILVGHAVNGISQAKVECKLNYDGVAHLSPEQVREKRAALQKTLNAGVRQTVNPLDEAPLPDDAAMAAMAGASSQAGQGQARPAGQHRDVASCLNPIMRGLYDKALFSWASAPPEAQAKLMSIMASLQEAADAGDQDRVNSLAQPLAQILSTL